MIITNNDDIDARMIIMMMIIAMLIMLIKHETNNIDHDSADYNSDDENDNGYHPRYDCYNSDMMMMMMTMTMTMTMTTMTMMMMMTTTTTMMMMMFANVCNTIESTTPNFTINGLYTPE
jgi:hypothetical protein